LSVRFDAFRGLVMVEASIYGPSGVARVRLALETGATLTLLGMDFLRGRKLTIDFRSGQITLGRPG
jgi:hypothetical protein